MITIHSISSFINNFFLWLVSNYIEDVPNSVSGLNLKSWPKFEVANYTPLFPVLFWPYVLDQIFELVKSVIFLNLLYHNWWSIEAGNFSFFSTLFLEYCCPVFHHLAKHSFVVYPRSHGHHPPGGLDSIPFKEMKALVFLATTPKEVSIKLL